MLMRSRYRGCIELRRLSYSAIEAGRVCCDKEKKHSQNRFGITGSTDNTDGVGEPSEILSFEFDGCFNEHFAMDALVLDNDFVEKQVPFNQEILLAT
jgi:hypothetical protein